MYLPGKLIIKLAPQIVILPSAPDKLGQPLVMEQFDFSPKDIFDAVTIDQYIMYGIIFLLIIFFVFLNIILFSYLLFYIHLILTTVNAFGNMFVLDI